MQGSGQGRYEEGLPHLRNALHAKERLLGKDHPDLASSLDAIGTSLRERGDPKAALPSHERAAAIREASFGKDHPKVADSLIGQGECHLALGAGDAAMPLLERALEIRETAKVDPVLVAEARFALARGAWAVGQRARARALAEEARDGFASGGERAREDLVEVEGWLASR